MSVAPRLIDRVAFAALVPSLAVPIIAIALSAWRMGHLDDARLSQHPGVGINYFAAMMTLSATLFSMSINTVLAVRNHASLGDRSIPVRRVWAHYLVTLVVAIWGVEFCIAVLGKEGLGFGIVVVAGSVASLAIVTKSRVAQTRVAGVGLSPQAKGVLVGYPFFVAAALVLAIAGLVPPSDLAITGVAILGFLGLPWSGVTAMLWLPVAVFFGGDMATVLPWIFLVVSGTPAVANAVLAVVLLRSAGRRTKFVNDFLEVALR